MKLIAFILLLLVTFHAKAQQGSTNDLISAFSSGDKAIKKALDSTVCVVKEEYSLVDKRGKEFGLDSLPYFGYTYNIGVITGNGIAISKGALMPWMVDKNYADFKKSDTLKPIISKTSLRKLGDKGFVKVQISRTDTSTTLPFATLIIPDSTKNVRVAQRLDTTGWVDMVSVRKNVVLSDTVRFTSSVYKTSIVYKDTSDIAYLKVDNIKDRVVGGIYYVCNITKGTIEFEAAGIIRNNHNGWYVDFFNRNEKQFAKAKEAKLTPAGSAPVRQKKSQRNNNN